MSFSVHCRYIRDASGECIGYELYLKSSAGIKNIVGHATKKSDDNSFNGREYFEFRPIKKLNSVISDGKFERMRQIKEMLRQHSDALTSRPLPVELFYIPYNYDYISHAIPEQIQDFDKQTQKKIILYWFYSNFDDSEGDADIHNYFYDIRHAIYMTFRGYADDEVVEQVVDELEHLPTKWTLNAIRRNYNNDSNFFQRYNPESKSEFSYNKVEPSELDGLNKEKLIDYIITHFRYFHCPPEEETPYDKKEDGKYFYIHGGPYDARDYINDTFKGIVSEEIIEAAIKKLDRDAGEWAPTPKHPSYQNYYYDERMRQIYDNDDNNKSFDALDEIQSRSDEDVTPQFGSDEEIKKRAEVNDKVDELLKALEKIPTHGGIGHNNPPTTLFHDCIFIGEVKQAAENIKTETEDPNTQPNISNVVESAGVLKKTLRWSAKKLNIAISGLMLALGVGLGKEIVGQIDVEVVSLLMGVYNVIASWLSVAGYLI